MGTEAAIPADVLIDLELICESIAAKMPIDPVLARRVHERAEKARDELTQRNGETNVAVDLIRELREE
jgi:hypothetical protein